jgi:hypothetical protein
VAVEWDKLIKREKNDLLQALPQLLDVKSDEAFGLVSSRHAESFGGLLDIKFEEVDDNHWDIPGQGHIDADEYLETLKIDPKLRFIPEAVLASRNNNAAIGVPGRCVMPAGLVVGDVEAMDVDKEVANGLVVAALKAQVPVSTSSGPGGSQVLLRVSDHAEDSPLQSSEPPTRPHAQGWKTGLGSTTR